MLPPPCRQHRCVHDGARSVIRPQPDGIGRHREHRPQRFAAEDALQVRVGIAGIRIDVPVSHRRRCQVDRPLPRFARPAAEGRRGPDVDVVVTGQHQVHAQLVEERRPVRTVGPRMTGVAGAAVVEGPVRPRDDEGGRVLRHHPAEPRPLRLQQRVRAPGILRADGEEQRAAVAEEVAGVRHPLGAVGGVVNEGVEVAGTARLRRVVVELVVADRERRHLRRHQRRCGQAAPRIVRAAVGQHVAAQDREADVRLQRTGLLQQRDRCVEPPRQRVVHVDVGQVQKRKRLAGRRREEAAGSGKGVTTRPVSIAAPTLEPVDLGAALQHRVRAAGLRVQVRDRVARAGHAPGCGERRVTLRRDLQEGARHPRVPADRDPRGHVRRGISHQQPRIRGGLLRTVRRVHRRAGRGEEEEQEQPRAGAARQHGPVTAAGISGRKPHP